MEPSNGQNRISKSERSGLLLPVSRVQSNLRKGHYADRIGTGGAIYLTAVLEYLTAEMLELAGEAAAQNKKRRITPRHIRLAIDKDAEFKELLKDVHISAGGVLPNIHPALLKPKSSDGNAEEPAADAEGQTDSDT